ncbi:MAG: helix-turn-helix domain-containing protein [Pseudomonadales bacterium]
MQTTTERPCVLWVDLRSRGNEAGDYSFPHEAWELHRCTDIQKIEEELNRLSPKLLCFDYDYPDTAGLDALAQTIQQFPKLPVIMVTQRHSAKLAVWALRSRVWDYLVKPVTAEDIVTCAERISSKLGNENLQEVACISRNPIPAELRFRAPQKNKVHLARVFVEDHYHEKIRVEKIAEFCGMNEGCFARCFKEEYNMTFCKYLSRFRMEKAKQMLRNPNASVTDVVYAVGFSDPSYFTRLFRRFTGTCPSCYRDEHGLSGGQQNRGSGVNVGLATGQGVI